MIRLRSMHCDRSILECHFENRFVEVFGPILKKNNEKPS